MAVSAPATGNARWMVLAGVAIPSFLGCIDFTIVNTALPAIQQGLGASVAGLQWVVNGFLVALSATMVMGGRIADLYGRRRLLFVGLAAFGGASAWAGAAGSIEWLIAARVVQGVACALLYTTSASIVTDAFPEAERGRAIGLLFGANGIGLAIGPAVGGVLAGTLGWRSIFLVNVPFVLLAAGLCLASVRESRVAPGARPEWAGGVLLLIAAPLLVTGILQGGAWGWSAPETIGLLLAAAVAITALIAVERRVADPLLPLGLLARPAFAAALIATAALAAFYCTAFFLLPIYLQSVAGLRTAPAGLLLLTATGGVALFSPVAGRLVDRHGVRPLLAGGFALFAVSATILALLPPHAALSWLVAALALLGVGWAFILGPSTVAAISALPGDASGLAVGIASTLHNLGGALGLAAGAAIFQRAGAARLTGSVADVATTDGLREALVSETAFGALIGPGAASPDGLHALFSATFLSGLHAAGWFLLAVSLAAGALVLWLSPRRPAGAEA